MKRDNKGFTLIELLAVIAILGILMIIAIGGISLLIENSRKKIYVNNALAYVKSAKVMVNNYSFEGIDFNDTDTTYYIHFSVVEMENETQSPFANFEDAYVVLIYTGDEKKPFVYYWTSKDLAGYRVDLEKESSLKPKSVYNDAKKPFNNKAPVGLRNKIVIIGPDHQITNTSQVVELSKEEADKCYSYELSKTGKTAKITYYNSSCGKEVKIPGIIDGYTITEIYSYAFYNMGLTGVVIPGTVTTIGSRAFASNSLTSVVLPGGLIKIDSEAFMNNAIPKIDLPNGLTTIGARAFKTNQLSTYSIPSSVTSLGSCAFCNNPIPNPSFLYVNGDKSAIRGYIGDLSEFSDKKFVIPAYNDGVPLRTIESSAFYSMGLKDWEVVIPDSVTNVKSSAFAQNGIAKINMPSSLTTVGGSAFYSNHIGELHIPSSVTSIGSLAFNANKVTSGDIWIYKRTASGIDYSTIIGYSGSNRSNIIIPPTSPNGTPLTTINGSAFRYLSLTGGITIPNSVKSIGSNAFALNKLSWVDNGDGDKSGPFVYSRKSDGGFDKSSLLQYAGYNTSNVVIPSNVKRIENNAFYYSYIKGVEIPEGVTYIGESAFQLCKLNGTVVIPSTVTTIGKLAFEKKVTWTSMNGGLTKIVNKTGKSFDWKAITGGPESATFETGTVKNWYGNIEVTKH